jgi:hypothetical protein
MRIHVVPTVNVRPTPLVGSTVAVALRYLTFQLAHLARPTWWPLINLPEYAPDTRLQDDDEGPRLRWDDDWLHFRAGGPRNGQREFSRVVRADPIGGRGELPTPQWCTVVPR